jgi:dTDP-glucose pyrophosphorylase
MAGEGSRFKQAGYDTPKPFLPVVGKAMIKQVMENVKPLEPHRYILIYRRDHKDYVEQIFSEHDNISGFVLNYKTEGAACTVLEAEGLLNNYRHEPLIIANSDQLVTWNDGEKAVKAHWGYTSNLHFKESNQIQDMINRARLDLCEGMIATFRASHPKWSYVKTRTEFCGIDLVTEVAEKEVISNHATCGIYYYSASHFFIDAAKEMIKNNERSNGEFYVCPVYNKIMKMNKTARIGHYPVLSMYGLGTPEDYERFITTTDKDSWYYGA